MGIKSLRGPCRQLPIPKSATRILGQFGLEVPNGYGASFSLRRSKNGPRATLHVEGFSWCLRLPENVKSFSAAREYITAYGLRYGQQISERRKPKSPRGAERDYERLRSGHIQEDWLKSDVPALYAAAMLRCKHPAGYCSEDGFCHYEDCFAKS